MFHCNKWTKDMMIKTDFSDKDIGIDIALKENKTGQTFGHNRQAVGNFLGCIADDVDQVVNAVVYQPRQTYVL